MQKPYGRLTLQITRTRKYQFLFFITRFLGTTGELADPADPLDSRHGAWCTTRGTLAPEVRMTVVLNKLPQIKKSQNLNVSRPGKGTFLGPSLKPSRTRFLSIFRTFGVKLGNPLE